MQFSIFNIVRGDTAMVYLYLVPNETRKRAKERDEKEIERNETE